MKTKAQASKQNPLWPIYTMEDIQLYDKDPTLWILLLGIIPHRNKLLVSYKCTEA